MQARQSSSERPLSITTNDEISCVSQKSPRCLQPPLTKPEVSTQVAIWSNIEAGLGITAGSLTTLRPLVRMLRESTSSSSSRIRTRASRSRSRSHKSSSGHQKESLSFRDESTKLWTGSYNDDYHGITTTVIGRGSSRDGRRSSSNGSTGEEDGTNINGNNINMVALDSFKVERSFQISITRH